MAKGLGALIVLLIVNIIALIWVGGLETITLYGSFDLMTLLAIITACNGAAIGLNILELRPWKRNSA